MMQYDFNQVIDRKNTDCFKWDNRVETFGTDALLPLWVADMDFASPPAVITAIKERAEHPIYGYALRPPEFYQAIIAWLKKRHQWEVKKEWLLITAGVVPAINLAILAFTEPGDQVIVQPPVYHPFFSAVENNGRKLVINKLKEENGRYFMNYEQLDSLANDRTKLMILCSPHNPVGRVWTKEELNTVGEFCRRKNILLVSDEIHADVVYKNYTHLPIASLRPELAHNTITCIAPSKTFNVAGLATSVVIIPDQAKFERFNKMMVALGMGMSNIFGIAALTAAYQYGEDWLEQLIDYLQGNLDFLVQFLAERIPRIRVIKPEGTFLVWLDCRDLGLNPQELKEFLIYKAKVGLNDGRGFGPGGEGFQRINIACPRQILQKALIRIERAVQRSINS
jgi:cystathionine beta-lyase